MPEPTDYSEGGSPIYKHGERKIPTRITGGDMEIIEAVEKHITEHVAEPESVFHELVSDLIHVDVHIVKPGPDRPFYTLVTSGMSEAPMNGQGEEGPFQCYAELCVLLPPDWKLDQDDFKDERNYFPIRWLKQLARLPHEYDTWLGYAHTIPNGDPAEPLAPGVGFIGWIILPSVSLSPDLLTLKIDEQREVNFFCIIPLYQDEMDYKLQRGGDALTDLFDKHRLSDVIDIHRPSVVSGKRPGGKPWWRRLLGG